MKSVHFCSPPSIFMNNLRLTWKRCGCLENPYPERKYTSENERHKHLGLFHISLIGEAKKTDTFGFVCLGGGNQE